MTLYKKISFDKRNQNPYNEARMEAYTMSTREQMELLADKLPEYKLAYVVAYMQGLLMADADETADDAYCEKLLKDYQNDPEKGQFVSFEDACKELGVSL